MNTGVMWINLAGLEREMAPLTKWTRANLARVCALSWDQGALRVWFHPLHRAAWRVRVPDALFYAVMSRLPVRGWKWDDLPLELNWKPYWGANDAACIVHFHGLKPTMRAAIAASTLAPSLAPMHTPEWDRCAAQWDAWLRRTEQI